MEELTIITSANGHPCIKFQNQFVKMYGCKNVGRFIFGDEQKTTLAKELVSEHYTEPYRSSAISYLNALDRHVAKELVEASCGVRRSSSAAIKLADYVAKGLIAPRIVSELGNEIDPDTEEPYWMGFESADFESRLRVSDYMVLNECIMVDLIED